MISFPTEEKLDSAYNLVTILNYICVLFISNPPYYES
jgi:hypothetical protein